MNNIPDKPILVFFQKQADRIQDYFGIDCYAVAQCFTVVLFITECIYSFLNYRLGVATVLLLSPMLLIAYVFCYKTLGVIRKKYLSNTSTQTVNSLAYNKSIITMRIFHIGMTMIYLSRIPNIIINGFASETYEIYLSKILSVDSLVWGFAGLCMIYFACCTPKPPRESKIRKLLKSLTFSSFRQPSLS